MKFEHENNFYQKESMNDVNIAEKNEGLQNQMMILQQELNMDRQIIHDLNMKKEILSQENNKLKLSMNKPCKFCVIF